MLFFIFWLFSSFRYWEGIGAYPSAFPFLNYSNWVNRYILVKKHIQRFKQRYLQRVLLFYRHKKRSLVWEIKKSTGYFFLKASMQKLEVSLTTDNYPASFLASTKLCIEGKWAIFRSHWRLALHDHCCSTNCSTNETWALILGIWKGCKRGNSKKGMQEHPFRLHICIEQSLKKSRKRSL